jgi:L-ascorbate metabolism protein UlaG (beta-lactamase superfamily)
MKITSFGHAATLVDTGTERILIDPWLTHRLDRFWERWPVLPDGADDALAGGVDAIIFTHHHYDHHHFPSLLGLNLAHEADFDETLAQRSAVRCYYPRGQVPPPFTASGLGHQAIGWTLRRLGFTNSSAVTAGETLVIGETTVRTFPSRVEFPEMSVLISGREGTVMFCGDALLHPATVEVFQAPDAPSVDVALVPTHSVSPPGVLTERRQVTGFGEVARRASSAFMRYVDVLNPAVTIPSSFGWRASGAEGESYDWVNKTIFPLTPWQAAGLASQAGRQTVLLGPGQTLAAGRQDGKQVEGPAFDFESIFREVAYDPDVKVPPFDPFREHVGVQRQTAEQLVERLCAELVGSDYWYRAAESGRTHVLEVACEDGTQAFVLDLNAGRALGVPTGHRGADNGFTQIAGPTLQALFDGALQFGSSFGLWISNENLLSAVFHHPKFYVEHVRRALDPAQRQAVL